MNPILSFLPDGCLPSSADEVRKVKKRVARFTILNDTLYKMCFSMPYLRCVEEDEAKYILEEVHEEICGDHTDQDPWLVKSLKQATTGQPYRRTQMNMWRNVINARGSVTFNVSSEKR